MRCKRLTALLMAACTGMALCAPVFAGGEIEDLVGEKQQWVDSTTRETEIVHMQYREDISYSIEGTKENPEIIAEWSAQTYGGLRSNNTLNSADYKYVSSYVPCREDFTVLGPDGRPADFDFEVIDNTGSYAQPPGYIVQFRSASARPGLYTVTMAREGYQFLYREYWDDAGYYQSEGMECKICPQPIVTMGQEDAQGNVKMKVELPDGYMRDKLVRIQSYTDGKDGVYNIGTSATVPAEFVFSKANCACDEDGFARITVRANFEDGGKPLSSGTYFYYRFPSDGGGSENPDKPDEPNPNEPNVPDEPEQPTRPATPSSSESGASSNEVTVKEEPKVYTTAQALTDLKKAEDGKVRLKNVAEIPYTALKALKGQNVVLQADQREKGKIVFRMTLDPSQASKNVKSIQTGAKLEDQKAQEKFEKYFSNEMRFIQLNQKGSYGMTVKIAAKMDLSGMDTEKLCFYSYDKAGNTYRLIANPQYYVDRNGYLHFAVTKGGTVIISEKPLERR